MNRQTAAVGMAALIVFGLVTFGLKPAVNFISRVRSPHGYSEYGMSGTWIAGLCAAGLTLVLGMAVVRRRH